MKIQSILLAQSIRLINISDFLSRVYLPDASKLVAERYGFMRSPTFEQLNSPTGGVFEHGKFLLDARAVRIDSLHIYNNALSAINRTSTDDTDAFLDDLMEFAYKELDAQLDAPTACSYISRLEVQAHMSFSSYFARLRPVEERITQEVSQYGFSDVKMQFQMTGFIVYFDTAKLATPPVQAFSIERRIQTPFEANVFFSQAPLKTSVHIASLEELENILRS